MNESNILLYETDEGKINIDVILKDETIWLTQKSMADLFECSSDNISLHLKNIFQENELDKNSTTEKISVVRKEGNRNVNRELEFYNLDAIIAVGYRVNSKKATKFRIWATKILKDYMIKGFVIDVEKMKNGSINTDYCKYCYEKGEFIDKVTMEEYIEMCSKYGSQAGMTNEEMKEHCTKLFPILKRWKNV